jgi:hypothetical protein
MHAPPLDSRSLLLPTLLPRRRSAVTINRHHLLCPNDLLLSLLLLLMLLLLLLLPITLTPFICIHIIKIIEQIIWCLFMLLHLLPRGPPPCRHLVHEMPRRPAATRGRHNMLYRPVINETIIIKQIIYVCIPHPLSWPVLC